MAEVAKPGLLDLETELTCSICTEVLYQPLTLLDCLHTFCGSCLKEWFSFEATHAKPTKPNPFTCPSCRASVRETRPNATVTTLLEMYVQANPTRARSEREKEALRLQFAPGENVLPKLEAKEETREEAADRRMVEEIRELSLRDVGIRGQGSYERGVRHRPREGRNEGRSGDNGRSSRQHLGRPDRDEERLTTTEQRMQARRIEHQSSLRSLLSTSDLDSSEMEEEILRQIMDDGILDGIDLDNIDVSQEDDLSEKIAEAYRRRHRRPRSRNHRADRARRSSSAENQTSPQQRSQIPRPGRSSRASEHNCHSSHPPLSRPHLLEAYPTGPAYKRRTSSETRRQTSPYLSTSSTPPMATQGTAARSATDLSIRQRRASNDTQLQSSGLPEQARRLTDVDRVSFERRAEREDARQSRTSRSARSNAQDRPATVERSLETVPARNTQGTGSTSPLLPPQSTVFQERQAAKIRRPSPPQASITKTTVSPPDSRPTFHEPSISCNRCGKARLEYDLHMNCKICNAGDYHLCLRCYRLGRGCLHWFGFGEVALQRHEHQAPSQAPPHRLHGHKYLRPRMDSKFASQPDQTYSDPSTRLQSGLFCSNCSTFAPGCFWSCDTCNEGEWGFCNHCVNQGNCCTHALLPIALTSHLPPIGSTSGTLTPHKQHDQRTVTSTTFAVSSANTSEPSRHQSEDSHFPLEVRVFCKICTYPIPPSATRYHCPQCDSGDYDICTPCYSHLVNRKILKPDDGPNGWRRCPQGHRMLIVGFQDSPTGQKRVVVEDLIGGRTLKEDHIQDLSVNTANGSRNNEWLWHDDGLEQRRITQTTRAHAAAAAASTTNLTLSEQADSPLLKNFPPSGGLGMHVQALWSYWPAEGVTDELAFPRGAEIRECEDINGDWLWGIYCGRKGLFPGPYGRIVGGN